MADIIVEDGATMLYDTSGHGNHGTVVNAERKAVQRECDRFQTEIDFAKKRSEMEEKALYPNLWEGLVSYGLPECWLTKKE